MGMGDTVLREQDRSNVGDVIMFIPEEEGERLFGYLEGYLYKPDQDRISVTTLFSNALKHANENAGFGELKLTQVRNKRIGFRSLEGMAVSSPLPSELLRISQTPGIKRTYAAFNLGDSRYMEITVQYDDGVVHLR